jgi:acyl carrier protein
MSFNLIDIKSVKEKEKKEMSNLEKYVEAFVNGLGVEESVVNPELKYQSVVEWDSVGHMALISELEDCFDIMMETDDIIDFDSFEKGKEILSKNYKIEF